MKTTKAVLKLYLYHIFILVIIFVAMGPLWFLMDNMPVLYSLITTVVYSCTVYSVAWNYGKKDGRKIPGSYPEPIFPVKVSAWASVLPIILFIVRFSFPYIISNNLPLINGKYDFFLTGNRLDGFVDFIFKLWYFPFGLFLGNGWFITYLLAVLWLPIMFISGYFVGLTKFRLLDFLSEKFVYTSKK